MSKVNFYSEKEVKELREIKKSTDLRSPERKQAIANWAKANNRSYAGVWYKVHNISVRKNKAAKPKFSDVQNTASFGVNEVRIPIKSFSISANELIIQY